MSWGRAGVQRKKNCKLRKSFGGARGQHAKRTAPLLSFCERSGGVSSICWNSCKRGRLNACSWWNGRRRGMFPEVCKALPVRHSEIVNFRNTILH